MGIAFCKDAVLSNTPPVGCQGRKEVAVYGHYLMFVAKGGMLTGAVDIQACRAP